MRKSWPDRRVLNRILNGLKTLRQRDDKHAEPPGGEDNPPMSS
jgi:hypothetical protein